MTTISGRDEAGFTLAEMLVALGVLGLGAALLGSTLHTAAGVTMRPRSAFAEDDTVVSAQRILRDRLERLSAAVPFDSGQPIVDARGDARSFSFVAPPLEREGAGALRSFRLILNPAGELNLYSASALDDRIDLRDPSLTGWQPARLLDGVADMELSYLGHDPLTGDRRWLNFWADRSSPPLLVRVQVRFAAGDRRLWPDLFVAPQATINSSCTPGRAGAGCSLP